MKQLYFFAFVFFSFTITSSYGQSFNAGILAGINASQVTGDSYSGFNKAGILVGLYSDIDISSKINLQFEINYSQKGSRKNPNTAEGDTEFFLLRLDYIDIPVMARVRHNKFTFEGGVYYGQLVNNYIEDENGPTEIPAEFNKFNEYDFGGLIGINFNVTENIIMNWRYSNSIIPTRRHDSNAVFWFNRGTYNNYMSFSLRYEFIGGN
ncbi:MAG: hypothetical protein CMC96_04740 [Flavobacteriales bacterium]|nr:hypothetical protein [Flavobacteriales bacterium]|tara:strand:- start:9971 stop:10594 length:624 start_codon:yes stop_codon:yes gene_type:complete